MTLVTTSAKESRNYHVKENKENKDTMSKKTNILFQRHLIAKNICI